MNDIVLCVATGGVLLDAARPELNLGPENYDQTKAWMEFAARNMYEEKCVGRAE